MTHTPAPVFDVDRIKPLSNAQLWQLMQGLSSDRVKERSGLSYVEAWDVKATLTRVFGFGGFSTHILSEGEVFRMEVPSSKGGKNWSIGYRVSLRLIIPQLGVYYDEAAVGSNAQGSIAEAYDNAVKGATSDALKRCATMLGTQFGLSLYDKGNRNEVIKTIVAEGQEWKDHAKVDVAAARAAREAAAQMGAIVDGQRPASAGDSVHHLKPEDVSAAKHEENKELLNNALSAQVKKKAARQDARTQPESAEGVDFAAAAAHERGQAAVLSHSADPLPEDPEYGGSGGDDAKFQGMAYEQM